MDYISEYGDVNFKIVDVNKPLKFKELTTNITIDVFNVTGSFLRISFVRRCKLFLCT